MRPKGPDAGEVRAQEALERLGYVCSPHPNGPNDPPDLLCDGEIAVEVTRVFWPENGTATPIRQLGFPTERAIMRLLERAESWVPDGAAFVVDVSYSRPLPRTPFKLLERKLRTFLEDSRSDGVIRQGSVALALHRATPIPGRGDFGFGVRTTGPNSAWSR